MWINLHDMCHPIPPSSTNKNPPTGFQFLWASERSGYRQLYLYQYISGGNSSSGSSSSSSRGNAHRSGTIHCLHGGRPVGGGGTWIVESIEAIDVERGLVYFSGNPGNHTEKHLLVASYIDSGGGSGIEGGNRSGGKGGGDSTIAMEITGEGGQQIVATT